MYIVRNVFRCKPGKAKDLVAKFKAARPHLDAAGGGSTRLLTDASAGFWTVVVETDIADLATWEKRLAEMGGNAQAQAAMQGYMDLVEGGYREIFKVE